MHGTRTRRKVGTLVLGVGLVAAFTPGIVAASGETTVPGTEPAGTEPAGTQPTGTAAGGGEIVQCGFAPSDVSNGDLSGFAGTTPLTDRPDFRDLVCGVDPQLVDFNYAGEAYDTVVITALAVEAAGTDGIEHASLINGITREGTKCTSFAECRDLIAAGEDVDYDGVSGPLEFDGNGEPTEASYGLLRMGDNNRIDPTLTEYFTVSGEPAYPEDVPVEGTREGDGVLTVGELLPQTGSLAYLGPPEFAGVQLAVDEINAAGGVLGQDVVVLEGDSGDMNTPTTSENTTARLLSENADVIVGAASSAVTLNVLDTITSAGVTMFSPANTSTELTDTPDRGLYFRAAPPDKFQADVLSQFVINDGNQTVAILNLNDSYGNSFAAQADTTIRESGGEVVVHLTYDPAAASFDTEVGEVAAANPDAVMVIGFDESSRILRAMVEQGIGPRDVNVYGTDGNITNGTGVNFDSGT
jgi:ABC-type branched-subunit amino acid transport system substrate-binding protein